MAIADITATRFESGDIGTTPLLDALADQEEHFSYLIASGQLSSDALARARRLSAEAGERLAATMPINNARIATTTRSSSRVNPASRAVATFGRRNT